MPVLSKEDCQRAGAAVAQDVRMLAGSRWPPTLAIVAKEAWRVRSMRQYVAEWGANYSTVSSRLNRRRSPSLRDVVTSIRLAIAALLLEGWACATADLAWVIGFSSPQSFARHVYVLRGLRLRAWKEGGYGAEVEALHRLLSERPWPIDLLARTDGIARKVRGSRRAHATQPRPVVVKVVCPQIEPVPPPYLVLTPEIASLMLDDWERRPASHTAGAQLRLRSA
jgi:AraC-like DNA-binding protein